MTIAKYVLFLLSSALTFASAWLFSFTETDSTTGRKHLTLPGKIALPAALALLLASLVIAYLDDRDKAAAALIAAGKEEDLKRQISDLNNKSDRVLELVTLMTQPQSVARNARITEVAESPALKQAARSDPKLQAVLKRLESALGGRNAQLQRLSATGIALPPNRDDILTVASVGLNMIAKSKKNASDAIVSMLRGLNADVFTIEEIADVDAFQGLMASLPQYNLVLGGSDSVMTQAVLFRKDRATLIDSPVLIGDAGVFQRRPLALRFKVQGTQFDLLAVHLKSMVGGREAVEQRAREAKAIAGWIDGLPQDRSYILVGRLHASPNAPELAPISAAGTSFTSKELPPDATTFLSEKFGPIVHSHIGSGRDMTRRYLVRSLTIHDLRRLMPGLSVQEIAENITDNNPISAAFRLD